jgi:hypothetical protein
MNLSEVQKDEESFKIFQSETTSFSFSKLKLKMAAQRILVIGGNGFTGKISALLLLLPSTSNFDGK